ncbi:MAG TPA: response regulator transcription factor [Terriglobales bacterium]|nr:response regulator transcription factor [Terriglobales bacterium]
MALRILVADDHEVVRRGLCALLEARPGWQVCAEASDGREAIAKARELRPDIVVMDIGMPSLNGLAAAGQIMQHNPRQRILILTITSSEQIIREVLEVGARGFVLKSDAARDLVTAVEALEQGRIFFTPQVGDMVLSGYLNGGGAKTVNLPRLTAREREIVQLLAEGKSTKEVAAVLHLSVKTAETHRSNVMRKLCIHSVSELVLYAIRNNIIQASVGPQGAKSSAA